MFEARPARSFAKAMLSPVQSFAKSGLASLQNLNTF
jgi:hypothetical protein